MQEHPRQGGAADLLGPVPHQEGLRLLVSLINVNLGGYGAALACKVSGVQELCRPAFTGWPGLFGVPLQGQGLSGSNRDLVGWVCTHNL